MGPRPQHRKETNIESALSHDRPKEKLPHSWGTNEIIIFSQTNRPGRSSSDELGEAREVRPFNEIFIFSQTNTPGKSSSDELGEAKEARPFRKRSRGGLEWWHAPPEKYQINDRTF